MKEGKDTPTDNDLGKLFASLKNAALTTKTIESGFRACEINPLYSMDNPNYAYFPCESCYKILTSEEVVIDSCFLHKRKK